MDRVDRQIIHCLQRDGRASFRRIGEVLDVSEQTVARRYRRLHGDGLLRVLALPDPAASRALTWFVRMQCRPDAAETLADALAARDDVSWVSLGAGGSELTCVTTSPASDPGGSVLLHRLPRAQQVLSFTAFAMLRAFEGGESEWFGFDDPLSGAQVSALLEGAAPSGRPVRSRATRTVPTPEDQPLLDELARDGRVGVVALARSTGWPVSRVAARLDALLDGGGVHVDLDLAPEPLGFHTAAYLWLTVAPGRLAAVGEALSQHPQTAYVAAVTGSAGLMASVICRSADDLYAYVTGEVGSLPGVQQAEIVPVLRRVKQAGTRVRGGRLVIEVGGTRAALDRTAARGGSSVRP